MTIIKELKVRRKIKNIYISDLAFVGATTMFGWLFQNSVASAMRIPFIAFNFLVGIILVMPSKWNPGKKMWQVMFFAVRKNRAVYEPISIDERSNDFEEFK